MKIAILFDRFGPYHIARMRGAMAYAEVLAIEGAPHRAIYDWVKPELPGGMAYCSLTGVKGEESDRTLVERRLDERVAPFAPDAIAIPGWSNMIALAALRWAKRRGIATICMSETNDWDFERRWLTERVKAGIVAHFDAGIATNDSQAGYLARLGIDERNIFRGYNAVDNDYFRDAAARWRGADALPSALAAFLPAGAKGRYFLASNRFIEKKNLLRLLDAYAAFRTERGDDPADWPLVLLGDGELRPQIEAKRDALGLGAHVHLPGFLQVDALPQYYGTAGAFVHASTTEQWGLVVNEAMAAGLPSAVSERCGSAQYLIEDSVTGFGFDPFSVEAIARALTRLAGLPADSPLRAAANARVETLRPERFGEGLAAAAQAGVARPAHPRAIDRIALDLSIRRAARAESRA